MKVGKVHIGVAVLLFGFALMVPLGASVPAGAAVRISMYAAAGPDQKPLFDRQLAEFRKIHPDVKVKLILAPWAQYATKLQTLIGAGDTPDVMWLIAGAGVAFDVTAFAKKGIILDLAPYVRFEGTGVIPAVLDLMRVDGGIYAVPFEFNNLLLYYNKDIFDKAGLEYPTEDWTWEDMLSDAKKLTRDFNGDGRIDQYGISNAADTYVNDLWIWQAGGEVFNGDGTKVMFDTPEALKGLGFWTDLMYTYKVSPPHSVQAQQAFGSLMTGRLAMSWGTGTWEVTALSEVDFMWGAVLLPEGPAGNRTTLQRANGWAVAKDSPHKDAAVNLAKFLGMGKGLDIWASSGRLAPYERFTPEYYLKIAEVPERHRAGWLEVNREAFKNIPNGRGHPRADLYNKVNQVLTNELEWVWNGKKDLARALREAQEHANQLLIQEKR